MKRFAPADLIDARQFSPAGRDAVRQLCLGIHRAMAPHRDDPRCAPYFLALARLDAESLARQQADEQEQAAQRPAPGRK
jgi:hypothetical protein